MAAVTYRLDRNMASCTKEGSALKSVSSLVQDGTTSLIVAVVIGKTTECGVSAIGRLRSGFANWSILVVCNVQLDFIFCVHGHCNCREICKEAQHLVRSINVLHYQNRKMVQLWVLKTIEFKGQRG